MALTNSEELQDRMRVASNNESGGSPGITTSPSGRGRMTFTVDPKVVFGDNWSVSLSAFSLPLSSLSIATCTVGISFFPCLRTHTRRWFSNKDGMSSCALLLIVLSFLLIPLICLS